MDIILWIGSYLLIPILILVVVSNDAYDRSFFYGFFAHAGSTAAIQDWYGLEGYIQLTNERWVEMPWWAGTIITCFFIWAYLGAKRREAT